MKMQVLLCGDYAGKKFHQYVCQKQGANPALVFDQQSRTFETYYAGPARNAMLHRGNAFMLPDTSLEQTTSIIMLLLCGDYAGTPFEEPSNLEVQHYAGVMDQPTTNFCAQVAVESFSYYAGAAQNTP